MTITEGGGRRAVTRKFQEVYLPSLKANFLLWPAVQILNFRVVPLQFQIASHYLERILEICWQGKQPFVSTVGIAWTASLSLTNSSDEIPIYFPTDWVFSLISAGIQKYWDQALGHPSTEFSVADTGWYSRAMLHILAVSMCRTMLSRQ